MTEVGICPATGKEIHPSRRAASKARRAFMARRRGASQGLEAYLCRACGGWHLGRHDAKRRRAA